MLAYSVLRSSRLSSDLPLQEAVSADLLAAECLKAEVGTFLVLKRVAASLVLLRDEAVPPAAEVPLAVPPAVVPAVPVAVPQE